MTFTLPLRDPPVTVQEPHQCWSAAYESWTTACSRLIPGAQLVTEPQIEAQISQYPDALDEDGGATLAGVGLLETVGDVSFQAVSGANLTSDLLQDVLTNFGHIYMPFWAHGRSGNLFSHAVVISTVEDGRMRIMDPAEGRGLDNKPVAVYNNAIVMFLGTHKRAHRS